MFTLCSCSVNFGNPTDPTDPIAPTDPTTPTDPTNNTELWINAVYNQGWKKQFLGSPLDEDFPFESNGNFIMDFNPSQFSPNTFETQLNTQFILDEVLDDVSGAYYRIIYTFGGENIELYTLISYGKFEHQMLIYLPKNDASAPSSGATTQVKKQWLKKEYVKGNFSSLGKLIAVKK